MEEFVFKSIGYVKTKAKTIPRHWSVSDVEGEIIVNPEYKIGLRDIKAPAHLTGQIQSVFQSLK